MKMKKVMALVLTGVMMASVTACGGSSTTATTAAATAAATEAATEAAGSEAYDASATVDFEMKTSESNTIVTVGEIDKSLYETPVLVTSFGQSTDAAMLDTVMKKAGVEYAYNATATADDVAGYKTVVIAVGASSKGLGAAGISESEEMARAEKFMEAVKANDVEVVCCHIGGSSRRGSLSDDFADMVMEVASYIVLKEDANFDYKFTKFAESNNVPITLIYATKDTVSVFTDLFAK